MEERRASPDRRTLTPAVVASALFVAACAAFAILFIGARGGLELPVYSPNPVAAATNAPTPARSTTPEPTSAPTPPPRSPPVPTIEPTVEPTPVPTLEPTPLAGPTFVLPTLRPGDPLLALPECPGRPGCFEYVVVRFDTVSGIISRYLLDYRVLAALNPGLQPDLIVVGQTLYLGRDPLARLDPCPDGDACVLYVVRAGDTLSGIAARHLTTQDAILAINPELPRPIQSGQVIRIPRTPG